MQHGALVLFVVWTLLIVKVARGCDEGSSAKPAVKINIYPTNGVMILNCTTKWTMEWMKENVTLLKGEERVTNDTRVVFIGEGTQKNLMIRDVTREDEGVYICCEYMPKEKMVEKYSVTIVENMTFTGKSPSFVSAINGTDVLLWCNVTGHPRPSVEWYVMQDKKLNYIGITGPLLRISGIDGICTTTYMCIATNKACPPLNHTVTVTLEALPRVFIDVDVGGDTENVTEYDEYLLVRRKRSGRAKTVRCSVDMNPVGNISWVVNHDWLGNATLDADGKFVSKKNFDYNIILGPDNRPTFEAHMVSRTNASLHMKLVVLESVDFELNYTCIATNRHGKDEWTVRFEEIPSG